MRTRSDRRRDCPALAGCLPVSRHLRAMSLPPLDRVAAILDRLTIAADEPARAALLERLCAPGSPTTLAFVNQHAVNLAWEHSDFAADLIGADVLLRDGVGMKAALAAIGRPAGVNLNGTDLIPEILARHRGRRIAVFGASDAALAKACETMGSRFGVDVVCTRDGWAHDGLYADDLARHPVDLVILAMGMPKQERIAGALKRQPGSRLIVCGGAIVDFLAGAVARAPAWMRRAGLEWAFRLAQEPDRLWTRYGPGGGAFAWRVARLRARVRS